jgi:hypothetical protein
MCPAVYPAPRHPGCNLRSHGVLLRHHPEVGAELGGLVGLERAPDGTSAVALSTLSASGGRVLGLAVIARPGEADDFVDGPSWVEPEFLRGLLGSSDLCDRCGCGNGPCELLPLACGLREGNLWVRWGGGVWLGYQV